MFIYNLRDYTRKIVSDISIMYHKIRCNKNSEFVPATWKISERVYIFINVWVKNRRRKMYNNVWL